MNELLEELLQSVPRIDKIIWLGDFNARAGSEWPVVFWGGTSQVKWIATVSCFLNSALNFCFKLRVHNWKAKTGLHYIRQPWQAGYLHRKISKKYMPKCFWSLIQPLEISLLRSNLRAWSYIYANIHTLPSSASSNWDSEISWSSIYNASHETLGLVPEKKALVDLRKSTKSLKYYLK